MEIKKRCQSVLALDVTIVLPDGQMESKPMIRLLLKQFWEKVIEAAMARRTTHESVRPTENLYDGRPASVLRLSMKLSLTQRDTQR